MIQKCNRTRSWTAMLFKNHRNNPIKSVLGSDAPNPYSLRCSCSMQAISLGRLHSGLAMPILTSSNVRAIGFRDMDVGSVHSVGFLRCRLTVSREGHGLLRGGNRSCAFDVLNQEVMKPVVTYLPGALCAPGNVSAQVVKWCLARLSCSCELLAAQVSCSRVTSSNHTHTHIHTHTHTQTHSHTHTHTNTHKHTQRDRHLPIVYYDMPYTSRMTYFSPAASGTGVIETPPIMYFVAGYTASMTGLHTKKTQHD